MPWKERDAMELRTEFCLRALEKDVPFKALCEAYGISRKTGYKWVNRFTAEGRGGMTDRSRRPQHNPDQYTEAMICRIVRLKLVHSKWGPVKIQQLCQRSRSGDERVPSLSTVKRVLADAGLVRPRRRRKPSQAGCLRYHGPVDAPNDLWTVDFKGWWRVRNGQRCEPLTVRDTASRYILCCRSLADARGETVRAEFEKLFRCYGLPRAIRMDNGSPWVNAGSPLGLTRLSAWWVALGIDLDRIDPGRPDQNGAHERMHRDLAAEVQAYGEEDLVRQQAALDLWRQEFNEQRPHEALNLQFPSELYTRSDRTYDGTAIEMTYPGLLRRKVTTPGRVSIDGRKIPVTTALIGHHVGLKPVENHRYVVWFGRLCLGMLDVSTESFTPSGRGWPAGALPPHPRDLPHGAQGTAGP